MYDIEALERQWIHYRRKRLVRVITIGVGVVILIAIPLSYSVFKESKTSGEDTPSKPAVAATKSSGSVAGSVGKVQASASTGNLAPGAPSLKKEKAPVKKPGKPKMVISFNDSSSVNTAEVEKSPGNRVIRMQMTDMNDAGTVREIEARFPDTRDYGDALYLARYYYRKKEYKKAETWALRANGIDSTQEESWLIYAKAKVKLGHRAEALRILQAYYDQTGSEETKILIDRIRKGKRF